MKRIFLIFFIIIIIFVFINLYNNDPRVIISGLSNNGNAHPSELRYKIHFAGVIPIGEAVLKINNKVAEEYQGHPVYHLTASAQSLNIFSQFFSSYAALDSYIDVQQFNPVLFRQKLIVKGQRGIEKEVSYDQKQGIMSMGGVRRQIFPDTQDPLSAIFNVRRLDFDKVKEFEMNINTNHKNYILKAVAHLKDISVKNKIYKTVFLEAEIYRADKNPYHKSRMMMVLWREKNNIPVLIKVFAGGIPINARLIDIQ